MKIKQIILLLLFSVVSSLSHADVFLSISGGKTDVGMDGFDDSGSYSLAAGLDLIEYLSVELAYIDLIDSNDDSIPEKDLSVDGINLSVLLRAPIYKGLGVYGKAGLFNWDATIDDPADRRHKDDGMDLSIGFGLNYAITEKITTSVGFHKFKLDDEDAESVMLGLEFSI